MFEKASRLKLRFDTDMGLASVEDLWDLPLVGGRACLNDIAKKLNKEIKESGEEDFVNETSAADDKLKLMFDIVLHVIKTKKDEAEKREKAAIAATKRDKVRSILEKKKDESLESLDIKELEKLLEE